MSQLALLRTRRFAPLFWTQFLGAFNDNFLKNALVILITFRSARVFGIASAEMVAVSGGVFILPFFLFSATAGQLADKYEKSGIICWIKLAEIAIMALAAYGLLSERFEFLLLVLFMMGVHSTFFGPIKYSILPQHLSDEELVAGNALIEAGTFLAILLGTIAGGILVSIERTGTAWVSGGLLAVALAGWWCSRGVPEAPPVDAGLRVRWNPGPPTRDILRFTMQTRSVYLSVLGISWFWFFGAAVLSLFPTYCRDVLHADGSVVTLFLACFSIGIGIGSMLCGRFSRKRLELGLVPLGSIGISFFAIELGLIGKPQFTSEPLHVGIGSFLEHPDGVLILLVLLFLSIFSGFFIVPLYTLIQERSEKSQRSRIIAGNNILNALFMVVASLLLVVLFHFDVSIPSIFLILGLLNAAVAVYIYFLLPEFFLRFVVWIIANLMYRLKVTGEERLPREGAALLICNHVSFVDWMIIAAGVGRPVRFIMDHSFAKGPLTRALLRQAKVILIASARENPDLLREAYARAAGELQSGELVCIFPEGGLTRDGKMVQFRPGVGKILGETPVPVIPMALTGLWGSFFSRQGGRAILKRPRRFWSRVELRIGEPVAPQDAELALLESRVSALAADAQ